MLKRLLTAIGLLLLLPATAGAATLHATPSTFASTFSSAAGGDTILLASGSYGSWNGGAKSSMVTIAPEAGAIVTFAGGTFGTSVRNITVQGVTYTSPVCINPPTGVKMGLILDGDTWGAMGTGCGEGRLSIRNGGTSAIDGNGVQIKNSTFGPGGCSDGIQDLSNGTEIGPGNEFKGIVQGSCTAHSDAIQPYASNFVHIHDNYLHDNEQGIMSPDGVSTGYLIENNVIHTTPGYPCMHLGDTRSGTVRHNVCRNGGIRVYGGNQNVASQNMRVQDNVSTGNDISACTGCTVDHNLTVSQVTFAGGTGRCAYATATPKGTGSDGTDIGLNDCTSNPPANAMPRLATSANKIVNASTGAPMLLRGANVMNSEWNGSMANERLGLPLLASQWKGNIIVRGIAADPVNARTASYLAWLDEYVSLGRTNGLYVTFSFRSYAINGAQPTQPDSRATSALTFLANRYRNDPHVLFGLQVEPHGVDWATLRPMFESMVDSIRGPNGSNSSTQPLIFVPGVNYSNDVSGAVTNPVNRPNVVYNTHPYTPQANWQHDWIGPFDAGLPVFVGEFTLDPNLSLDMTAINNLLAIARGRGIGWTAWIFDTCGCTSGQEGLITSWSTATPRDPFGVAVKNEMVGTPPPPPPDHTPVARFTASPEPSAPGQTATFDATSSTCEDTPCVYHWHDVGPPNTQGSCANGTGDWALGANGSTMTFAFSATGTKCVELVLTDADGDVAKVEHDHVVSTAAPPPPPPSLDIANLRRDDVATNDASQYGLIWFFWDAPQAAVAEYDLYVDGQPWWEHPTATHWWVGSPSWGCGSTHTIGVQAVGTDGNVGPRNTQTMSTAAC